MMPTDGPSDPTVPRRSGRGEGALLVEVMGPAGAGKTSLVRALRVLDPDVRAGLGVGRAAWVPILVARVARLLPLWLLRSPRGRWFTWNELKSMSFLDAWLRAARRRPPGGAVVLDHGPVYRLARLRAFGPPLVRTPSFARWWRRCLEGWWGALDLIVHLDAPDEVLLERVGARGHWYLSGDGAVEEKVGFLHRYRRAFDETMSDAGRGGPTVLRIRSDRAAPEAIAAQVLRELRGPSAEARTGASRR
jgi:energy-coupling factor transporter ATP-binding protein EcfA2